MLEKGAKRHFYSRGTESSFISHLMPKNLSVWTKQQIGGVP